MLTDNVYTNISMVPGFIAVACGSQYIHDKGTVKANTVKTDATCCMQIIVV